jgi:uncharacterized protein
MKELTSRVWKKIAVFYLLTLALSALFYVPILLAGLRAGDLFFATGLMWCPALAALSTKALFRESARELGWKWGDGDYQICSYLIPIAYTLPVYLIIWVTRLGGFYDADFVAKKAADFGWSGQSPAIVLMGYIALSATVGVLISTSRSLGEEIGWRGFLVPELAKVVPFRGVALISGLMWAAWHYPILLFGDYNRGAPAWFSLMCFTIMIVAVSFIMARLRLCSGSLWTAALLHASHNRLIQSVFTPLTTDTGMTAYFIDEFGVGLVVSTVIAAVIVSRRRSANPACEERKKP